MIFLHKYAAFFASLPPDSLFASAPMELQQLNCLEALQQINLYICKKIAL